MVSQVEFSMCKDSMARKKKGQDEKKIDGIFRDERQRYKVWLESTCLVSFIYPGKKKFYKLLKEFEEEEPGQNYIL